MDGLAELSPYLDLGATGVLLVVIWWIVRLEMRGDRVSRRELDYVRADRDARLAEKDAEIAYLRGAHETSERARELLNQQNRDLIGAFRTFEHFFDSLKQLAQKGGEASVSS